MKNHKMTIDVCFESEEMGIRYNGIMEFLAKKTGGKFYCPIVAEYPSLILGKIDENVK